jgi:uncharacterized protein YjbI with pentapeptide repeats
MGFHAVKNAGITVCGSRTDEINSRGRMRQMAKPEHLAKIEESVEVWNMWRYDNPEIVPGFWGADLEEADLRGAYLDSSDLEEAVLVGADLRNADLRDAKLRNADLRGANLMGADFGNADLKRADLEGANLMGAIFLRAEQLCETKTLFQAELDPDLEREVKKERPQLFEKPREKANR